MPIVWFKLIFNSFFNFIFDLDTKSPASFAFGEQALDFPVDAVAAGAQRDALLSVEASSDGAQA